MKVVAEGMAMASQPGADRSSLAFPGIAALPGGRWLCACRAAPTKDARAGQHVLLAWSDDEGGEWSEPRAPFTSVPELDGRPGAFRTLRLTSLGADRVLGVLGWVDHSDTSKPFFNEETEGLLDMRIFSAVSEDAGATWSEPVLIEPSPFDCPTPLTGPILALANGDWALQFETNKHYDDTSVWRHASVLMFSGDYGRTWPEHVRVSYDPEARLFYWDQRPGVLADGRVLDVFWTFDRRDAVYLNIHARESGDNGRTWSAMWDTGVPGQPAPPVSLPGGSIAMVYVDRTAAPAIKVRTSTDGGRTWPAQTECVIYDSAAGSQEISKSSMQDAWAEMGRFSVGLPATARLPDGDLLTVYYAGPETDRTNVCWARLAP